jgi:transcription antitermination factor NusG
MDLMDLLKLAGIAVQSQQVSSEPSCGDGMGESEGAGFDEATTEPNPAEFPDGISTLGSVSDTSLRRYLKARGDHVTVDEDIYPDYAVEDVAESYKAFAEKAKNPYAVGMAQAMKSTGDEPPLKKSTIKKAHDIAKAVNEGSSNLGDTYMKHLHIKYNNKKSLSKSEAKEVKDLMTRNTIADIKKLAASGIRHVSDAAKDHLERYVPSNMKKESAELDKAALQQLRKEVWNAIREIQTGAAAGKDMTDDILDELGDYYDDVQASGDPDLIKAYTEVRSDAPDQPLRVQAKIALLAMNAIFNAYKRDKAVKEAEEDIKVGDTVKPTKGPHKGHPHEVIHDFGDGHYNVKPVGLRANQIRYGLGAAKAHKSDLVKEEITNEAANPDYIDGDGDKKEPMKKAAKDKEETKANESLEYLKKLAGVA